jgi:hypothetical protein
MRRWEEFKNIANRPLKENYFETLKRLYPEKDLYIDIVNYIIENHFILSTINTVDFELSEYFDTSDIDIIGKLCKIDSRFMYLLCEKEHGRYAVDLWMELVTENPKLIQYVPPILIIMRRALLTDTSIIPHIRTSEDQTYYKNMSSEEDKIISLKIVSDIANCIRMLNRNCATYLYIRDIYELMQKILKLTHPDTMKIKYKIMEIFYETMQNKYRQLSEITKKLEFDKNYRFSLDNEIEAQMFRADHILFRFTECEDGTILFYMVVSKNIIDYSDILICENLGSNSYMIVSNKSLEKICECKTIYVGSDVFINYKNKSLRIGHGKATLFSEYQIDKVNTVNTINYLTYSDNNNKKNIIKYRSNISSFPEPIYEKIMYVDKFNAVICFHKKNVCIMRYRDLKNPIFIKKYDEFTAMGSFKNEICFYEIALNNKECIIALTSEEIYIYDSAIVDIRTDKFKINFNNKIIIGKYKEDLSIEYNDIERYSDYLFAFSDDFIDVYSNLNLTLLFKVHPMIKYTLYKTRKENNMTILELCDKSGILYTYAIVEVPSKKPLLFECRTIHIVTDCVCISELGDSIMINGSKQLTPYFNTIKYDNFHITRMEKNENVVIIENGNDSYLLIGRDLLKYDRVESIYFKKSQRILITDNGLTSIISDVKISKKNIYTKIYDMRDVECDEFKYISKNKGILISNKGLWGIYNKTSIIYTKEPIFAKQYCILTRDEMYSVIHIDYLNLQNENHFKFEYTDVIVDMDIECYVGDELVKLI